MARSELDNYLGSDTEIIPDYDELKKSFGETNIEKYKEEDFVLRSVMQGKDKNWILSELEQKHDDKFTSNDFKNFLLKNQKIFDLAKQTKGIATRRLIEARADVEEKMASLIIFTEQLVKKYDGQGDNQSTVAAINVLNKTLMNYSKLAGYLHEEKKESKNIINIITDRNARLANEVISADFKMVEEKVE